MHLEVYRNRPDARAVVHAHPPTATGFAVAGIPLDRAVLAEVITTLGSIPLAEYATPSTERTAGGGPQVRQGARRHSARQSRRAGAWRATSSPPTTGWRRSSTSRRSAWWRTRSAGSTCCRARKWIGCRGSAACTASRRRRRSAPTTDATPATAAQLDCQVVQAPDSRRRSAWCPTRRRRCRRQRSRHGRGNSANIPRADRLD